MNEKVAAMILAGGKGTRLQGLTRKTAKPAVSFAAKYRIIDFPLSNCANSGISDVGVLIQYESTDLDNYIGDGSKWGLNGIHCNMCTLAPRVTQKQANWYKGTADAIAQNLDFIEKVKADYVLILSGDHIYKSKYNELINQHIEHNADCTISAIQVPSKDASRFGIITSTPSGRITSFIEKPKKPTSNLANMGIYIFKTRVLKKYLLADMEDKCSNHDFGMDIIPKMLKDKKRLYIHRFSGYWRDVGTLDSLHQANMDLADGTVDAKVFYSDDQSDRIYSEDIYSVPQYIGKHAKIVSSVANQGSIILGSVDHCIISTGVTIHEGAVLDRCVIMQGAEIMENAKIHNAIIAPNVRVRVNSRINLNRKKVILVSK